MPRTPRRGIKRPAEVQAREYKQYSRNHTMFIRDDVWAALEVFTEQVNRQQPKGSKLITKKQVLEAVLFKGILSDALFKEYGIPDVEIEDTIWDGNQIRMRIPQDDE